MTDFELRCYLHILEDAWKEFDREEANLFDAFERNKSRYLAEDDDYAEWLRRKRRRRLLKSKKKSDRITKYKQSPLRHTHHDHLSKGAHRISHEGFYGEIIIQKFGDALSCAHQASQPRTESGNELILWVDGSVSRKPSSSGAAVVYKRKIHDSDWVKEAFCLTDINGSHEAELFAIRAALQTAVGKAQPAERNNDTDGDHGPAITKVIIFSDSQSALNHIPKPPPSGSKITMMKEDRLAWSIATESFRLNQLGISLELRWVPAHMDVPGNEEADKVAKRAAQYSTQTRAAIDISDPVYHDGVLSCPVPPEWLEEGRIRRTSDTTPVRDMTAAS
jgi:ribonuclease HI